MKPIAKLIHKTNMSYLPTAFPAHFYGMPNGKVYLIFSRFYDIRFGDSGLEFVFAEHKEFFYDYDKEEIMPSVRIKKKSPIFAEYVDKPNPKIDVFEINRDIYSYSEALSFLNNIMQNTKIYA